MAIRSQATASSQAARPRLFHLNPLERSRGEVAIYLAGQGFPMLPCHWPLQTGENAVCSCSLLPKRYQMDHSTEVGHKKIGKHPVVRLVPHAAYSATTDPAVIRGWLAEDPTLNFGLATGGAYVVAGETCFLVVIDPDSAEAEIQLRANVTMFKTFEVVTGNGKHLYYWTDVPMSNASGLLRAAIGSDNVDVKALGGYVMAPGSLHYSGATYTATSPLSYIVPASEGLQGYLVPASEPNKTTGRRRRSGDDNVTAMTAIKAKLATLPRLSYVPPEVVEFLHTDPADGLRSEPAFRAMRLLTDLSDDDRAIARTILESNLGKRYLDRPLDVILQQIQKARDWPSTPEGQAEHFLEKQRKLVDEQWVAAAVLPAMTRKVLHGFQQISLVRGGGTFTASLAEVAIEAGVEINTVRRHRGKLIAGGWLVCVHQADPGQGYASRYRLTVPKADIGDTHPTLLGGDARMSSPRRGSRRRILRRTSALGEKSAPGENPAQNSNPDRKSPQEKAPLVDLSADSARYATTNTMWEVLLYVTEETTAKALARDMGKSRRHVRRVTARLQELGLIADRQKIHLMPNWPEVWDNLAVVKGTAGKKQSAVERLRRTRLARTRARLLYTGEAVTDEHGNVVVAATGEIV
jgi:Bifunctional DNA primase/polymerase, N-terminal